MSNCTILENNPPAIFVQVFSLKMLTCGLGYGNIRPWKSDPATSR
nr:MAG TPA: hypothetical protein [Herelleviridae sp.]